MITNAQITRYLREQVRGEWQKYFTVQELADVHGLKGKFRVLAEDHLPISLTRKEIISNLAKHVSVWIDGYAALPHALMYLSPAIPSCTDVHVNAIPEVASVLDTLTARYQAGDFNDWDTELVVHTAGHTNTTALAKAIPDNVDTAVVVVYEASQTYMEVLIGKLAVGGVIWLEASTLGGRPILQPNSEIARLNGWISHQPNLEVSMGIDSIGYTMIRKVS